MGESIWPCIEAVRAFFCHMRSKNRKSKRVYVTFYSASQEFKCRNIKMDLYISYKLKNQHKKSLFSGGREHLAMYRSSLYHMRSKNKKSTRVYVTFYSASQGFRCRKTKMDLYRKKLNLIFSFTKFYYIACQCEKICLKMELFKLIRMSIFCHIKNRYYKTVRPL